MVTILPLIILVYSGIIVFLGDRIYLWFLNLVAKRKLNKIGYQIDELDFSFEQIVYLVSTPSSNYQFNNLECHYQIEELRESILWPEINLLKIVAYTKTGEKKDVALIRKNKFPVPILDTLVYHNKISSWEYNLFISYIFSNPRTKELLLEEVRTRVTQG